VKIRTDLTDWSKQFRSDILGSFRESGGPASSPPGIGHSSSSRQASVDRKEVAI
jgi:hypothetical protein